VVVFRDMVIFVLGVLIIARQAGIVFEPPKDVSIELLTIGALMANVPGILHVIAWRSGAATASLSSPPDSPPPASPAGQLPGSSSGGER
jgi:hypothetical protein